MVYSLLRAMHGLRTFPSDDDNDYEHATSGHGPGVTTMVEPGRDGLCLLDPKDKEAAAILPAATAAACCKLTHPTNTLALSQVRAGPIPSHCATGWTDKAREARIDALLAALESSSAATQTCGGLQAAAVERQTRSCARPFSGLAASPYGV